MKRYLLIALSLVTVLALTGCQSKASDGNGGSTGGLTESYDDALPILAQMALGTVNLEETDLAVDVEQAEELLPLWQAMQVLAGNDTTAQAELDAMEKQILNAMTDEQIAAIAEMQIKSSEVMGLMGGMGASNRDFEAAAGDGDSEGGFQMPAGGFGGGATGGGRAGGGMPVPGDGGGATGGVDREAMQNMTEEERATAVAERMGQIDWGNNPMLYRSVVRLLELKLAAE